MIYKNHNLKSIKNSNKIFKCEKCDNIIQHQIFGSDWWYYLDYSNGIFMPLKDCNDMIIKEIIE